MPDADTQTMRDHWWWRPGWKQGRSFYTWHITFAGQPGAASLVEHYAPLLADLPTLDPVPLPWLHLTLQGVGFTDEVSSDDVSEIVAAAQHRCAALQPFTITLGPAFVDPETVQVHVQPAEPVAAVRKAIRRAIADVWGSDGVPEPEEGFRAHVSLAYSNTNGPAEPLSHALAAHPPTTADVTVPSVSLINLNRDNKTYEWVDVASADLAPS